jgi:hypothetical protein
MLFIALGFFTIFCAAKVFHEFKYLPQNINATKTTHLTNVPIFETCARRVSQSNDMA